MMYNYGVGAQSRRSKIIHFGNFLENGFLFKLLNNNDKKCNKNSKVNQ